MEWVIHLLRQHSELAIFLTIAAGFWIGKMKIKQFSLGIVTSVLLVGVLVGQLNITIEEPVKSVFFLLVSSINSIYPLVSDSRTL